MFVPIFIFCLFVHQYFIFIKCYCFRRMPFILQSVTNWMIPRSCKTFIIRCICVMCNVYACIYDIQWILDWELFLVVFFLFQICHVKVSLRLSWQWHWTINIVVKSFFLWFFFLSFFCFATLFFIAFSANILWHMIFRAPLSPSSSPIRFFFQCWVGTHRNVKKLFVSLVIYLDSMLLADISYRAWMHFHNEDFFFESEEAGSKIWEK